jgi:2-hydroxy-palmitic acid dioxygenase Mpo1-like
MIYPPQPPNRLVGHWIERHRNWTSFILHILGIPPTILGALLCSIYVGLLSVPVFLFALALFLGGYVLQFAGHALEGTDPGEVIFFKRKLGMSYVEFPPGRVPGLSPTATHRQRGQGEAAAAIG